MFRTAHKVDNDQIKQQFLPRTDKYRELINNHLMPSSHQSRIVIPCLTKTYGFKTNQYRIHQRFLDSVIAPQEFNAFVRKANRIIEQQLINKSNQENEPFFGRIAVLRNISIVIAALALFLLAVTVYSSIEGTAADIVLYISVILLMGSGLIAGLCPIFLFNFKYSAKNYDEIMFGQLRKLQADENRFNEARQRKHVTWHIHNDFYWIELHIDRTMLPQRAKIIQEVSSGPSSVL